MSSDQVDTWIKAGLIIVNIAFYSFMLCYIGRIVYLCIKDWKKK